MKKKKLLLTSGLLVRKEEDKRENSDLRVGRDSSGLECSCLASKKMRKEKGRGVSRERIRRRRWSERWIAAVGDCDRR